jgi:hypothetical protein
MLLVALMSLAADLCACMQQPEMFPNRAYLLTMPCMSCSYDDIVDISKRDAADLEPSGMLLM